MKKYEYDAVVIGSGPNGLAAAITLAKTGLSVLICEAKEKIGGGMRSAELTRPGFLHDVCSSIYPLTIDSKFFKTIPLKDLGLKWIYPEISVAHPFDDGSSVFINNSTDESLSILGKDSDSYKKIILPLVKNWGKISEDILSPLKFPKHPIHLLKFGLKAILPASIFIRKYFNEEKAKSLFTGMAAHSIQSLDNYFTSAIGLVLSILAHKIGFPMPEGGAEKISETLKEYFTSLGGTIFTELNVTSLKQLPSSRVYLFDLTPAQILCIEGIKFPSFYQRQMKKYKYGSGVFKIDYALSNPIPFKSEHCRKAGTIHIGGFSNEIIESENQVSQGKHPEKPFLLLAQHSLFDKTRAPKGKHTAWVYTHVPNGSTFDMTERIENQIERFAPGFRDIIIDKHLMYPADFQNYNSNYIGGDINGGVQNWRQIFTRPVIKLNPYSTPQKGIYICSSSTPPGGGVHGLCGYYAAISVLENLKLIK